MNQGTGTMDYYLDFPELNLQNFRLAKTAMLGMLMEVGKPVEGAHRCIPPLGGMLGLCVLPLHGSSSLVPQWPTRGVIHLGLV